jgi:hypothetical protein
VTAAAAPTHLPVATCYRLLFDPGEWTVSMWRIGVIHPDGHVFVSEGSIFPSLF